MAYKKTWVDHVKDDTFVRNFLLIIFFIFVLASIIILYFMGDLDAKHFITTLDIAIGIVVGGFLFKALGKKQNG